MSTRIGVDVSDLCTNRADGTTRYTRELWRGLPKVKPGADWHWFAPCEAPEVGAGSWHASPWPKYWTQLRFPWALYRHRPDVLFMPIQQVPIFRPRRTKIIATVHDLAFHYFPEQFRYKDWALLHLFTAHAVRVADHIVADSQATADDIAREYGRTDNISVVHLGVNHKTFREPSAEEKAKAAQEITAHHPKLAEPYLLFVGQIQPRKNLIRLLDAFAEAKQTNPELNLVIVGSHGWLQKPILKHIAESPVADSIIHLANVPDALLPALYWQAELLTMPSLYEGFGLPVLEAMASGTPVVTSNVSSLPEVAGDAAILCDPYSTDSIADGIKEALASQEEMGRRGLQHARQFGWDATLAKLGGLFDNYA